MFSINGPVSLSAGGAVELSPRNVDARYFSTSYGSILIRRPGLYYAAVTVDIPKYTEADTTMRLELNNQTISPPEIVVSADDDGNTKNYAGHTVFYANGGSVLKLSSLKDLAVGCSTSSPVFTLTLTRIR